MVAAALVGCTAAPPAGPSAAELDYLRATLADHRAAVAVAQLVPGRSERFDVRTLGDQVVLGHGDHVRRILRLLEDAGAAPTPAPTGAALRPADVERLSVLGPGPFDDGFLEAMTAHHERQVARDDAVLADGPSPEVEELATRIRADLEQDLVQLREAVRNPSVVVPQPTAS